MKFNNLSDEIIRLIIESDNTGNVYRNLRNTCKKYYYYKNTQLLKISYSNDIAQLILKYHPIYKSNKYFKLNKFIDDLKIIIINYWESEFYIFLSKIEEIFNNCLNIVITQSCLIKTLNFQHIYYDFIAFIYVIYNDMNKLIKK